jgi:hypothetical protein
MGGACSTYGGKKDVYRVLVGKPEALRQRDHLKDPSVGKWIIFRLIFRKWDVGGMNWIDVALDRDRWSHL